MVARSREEVVFATYLCDVLGLGTDPASVVATLHDGARHGLFDQRLRLSPSCVLMVDYDGGYYHTTERAPNDERKTVACLRADAAHVVLRVRVNAPPLDIGDSQERCVVVHVADANVVRTIAAVAKELAPRVPEPYATRLRNVREHERRVARAAAHEALLRIDAQYRDQLRRVNEVVGERYARQLARVHGVPTLIASGMLRPCLQRLRGDEFRMSTKQIVTFMRNGVAARIAEASFLEAVRVLYREFGMTTDQVVTFMSDSVAARIAEALFLEAVRVLYREFGMTTHQVVTFMSNSVAARIAEASFLEAVRALYREFGMTTHQVVTFMSNSVAARIAEASFLEAVRTLYREFRMTTDQVVTFMSGGVAARIAEASFLEAVRALYREFGMTTHQVVTFMNDGVAARIENPIFLEAMRAERKRTSSSSLPSRKRVRAICKTIVTR
jgi:hypothetical protein